MRAVKRFKYWAVSFLVLASLIFATPFLLSQYLNIKYSRDISLDEQFPVGVNPINKTIVEDDRVEAYFPDQDSVIQSATLFLAGGLREIFSRLLESDMLALVSTEKFVSISPGLRKEEVAVKFARTLGWNEKQKKEFLSVREGEHLPLVEGSFFPGIYAVSRSATTQEVQELLNGRFTSQVLARYGTSTAEIIPLHTALTIASLIERETIGTDDMRVISGIIWNRIFADMNLQLDATLQYAKTNNKKVTVWWPEVRPQDKFIKSPYNTYMNNGLPPTPIANPSVAAIVAALNPLKTECIFYFHDKKGGFHCAPTYKEHVALLKQHYGRGK